MTLKQTLRLVVVVAAMIPLACGDSHHIATAVDAGDSCAEKGGKCTAPVSDFINANADGCDATHKRDVDTKCAKDAFGGESVCCVPRPTCASRGGRCASSCGTNEVAKDGLVCSLTLQTCCVPEEDPFVPPTKDASADGDAGDAE